MKILNSKEAFEAMMAGRNIMCRAAGELMDVVRSLKEV